MTSERDQANAEAFRRLTTSDPVLEDIRPAIEALQGMRPDLILTSGPGMPWQAYAGGQRSAIIGAALFEGLAEDRQAAERKLETRQIRIEGCHEHGCVGSLAGVYTASMPVFVVRNAAFGNFGYCNLYEGTNPRRLNYGVYDSGVHERLSYVNDVVAPVLAKAVRRSGGIGLKPIMQRALHMSDELHSRNTAASLLFMRELIPHLLEVAREDREGVAKTIAAMTEDHYFFLRLSMAAAKATADAAAGIERSSMVTAMAFNCREFAIRVSGLGSAWFCGPHPEVQAKLFEGHSEDEITWMGGESIIAETIGLGGFAQAAAFPLQNYQGGDPEAMVRRNLALYDITLGENPDYKIPYLKYRGTPTGIDIFKVLETGTAPVMDIGIAGRDGGQIGAGVVRARLECFEAAKVAYLQRYGSA
ncbi:MAG TPA: DUF1116 domain-containing protein [Alphaproteobacteria bacterium]|nr:DUF1116 domain-containing protein [Alphaproteobacteria bacterium]